MADGMWGYGPKDGPHTWYLNYPAAGGGSQSPINIEMDKAKYDMTLNIHPLRVCIHKNQVTSQTLVLTKHNFRIDYEGSACVSGGPLQYGQMYSVAQVLFHYGSNIYGGSEHLINCFQFPCECQILCYNSSRYRCFADAQHKKDGLVILSIMMHIGAKNKAIDKIVGPLTSIHYFKTHDFRQEPEVMDLSQLLPKCTNRYYTYPGSLTTPPCYETVTWIVMEGSITLSEDQLHEFQKVHIADDCGGPDNFRSVCPLGERYVSKNFM